MIEKKIAFLFSGQGAQTVGMGKELIEKYPSIQKLFNDANDVLGYNLSKIILEGPETELTNSKHCQPAIFTVSVAYLKAFEEEKENKSFVPSFLAGLSLGEWTALYVSKVISFEQALKILAARGSFMQEACEEHPGTMSSVIGMSEEAINSIAKEAGCFVANYNSPEQIVLSGEKSAIHKANELAKSKGAKKVIPLAVAGAYHSPLMASAAEKLKSFLDGIKFSPPQIPVLSNVSGLPHNNQPEAIKEAMVKQVVSSVRWVDCIKYINSQNVNTFVEFGPGKVLTGLTKRIVSDTICYNNPLALN